MTCCSMGKSQQVFALICNSVRPTMNTSRLTFPINFLETELKVKFFFFSLLRKVTDLVAHWLTDHGGVSDYITGI